MAEEIVTTFTLSEKEAIAFYGEMFDNQSNVKTIVSILGISYGATFGFISLLLGLDRFPALIVAFFGFLATWLWLRLTYGKSFAKQVLELHPGLVKEQSVRLADKLYGDDENYSYAVGWPLVHSARLLESSVGLSFAGAILVIPDRAAPNGMDELLDLLRSKGVDING